MKTIWHKYKAIKSDYGGYSFASKCEAGLFQLLKLIEKAGEISNIQVQDHVYLTDARICMIPDFKILNTLTKESEWYEAKGFETTDYRIKRKLWTVYGPGKLHVYKCRGTTPYLHEVIIPEGSKCLK